jgi:hypothetical protein
VDKAQARNVGLSENLSFLGFDQFCHLFGHQNLDGRIFGVSYLLGDFLAHILIESTFTVPAHARQSR